MHKFFFDGHKNAEPYCFYWQIVSNSSMLDNHTYNEDDIFKSYHMHNNMNFSRLSLDSNDFIQCI